MLPLASGTQQLSLVGGIRGEIFSADPVACPLAVFPSGSSHWHFDSINQLKCYRSFEPDIFSVVLASGIHPLYLFKSCESSVNSSLILAESNAGGRSGVDGLEHAFGKEGSGNALASYCGRPQCTVLIHGGAVRSLFEHFLKFYS